MGLCKRVWVLWTQASWWRNFGLLLLWAKSRITLKRNLIGCTFREHYLKIVLLWAWKDFLEQTFSSTSWNLNAIKGYFGVQQFFFSLNGPRGRSISCSVRAGLRKTLQNVGRPPSGCKPGVRTLEFTLPAPPWLTDSVMPSDCIFRNLCFRPCEKELMVALRWLWIFLS